MKSLTKTFIKTLSALFIIAISVAMIGCKGSKKEETAEISGMIKVDLTSYGLPVTINLPDSTKGKLEIEAAADGTIKIKVRKAFQISLYEDPGDITLKKSDIAGDEVKKLQKYVIDEPTTILYETLITEPEFHFYTIVKAGDKSYVVEDIVGEIFSEEAAKTMLESAKSIVLKEKAES